MLPLIVRVDNLSTQTSTQYAFARSPVRIGRNNLNDLALEFPFVSQWHAVVQFDEQTTQYFDLGSTNGTTVNGQRAGKNVPIAMAPNMEFRIGALRLFFARADAPAHLFQQRTSQGGGFGSSVAESFEHTMIAESLDPPPSDATVMIDNAGGNYAPRPAAGVPAARPPGPPPTSPGQMAQVRAGIQQLRGSYDAYRRAWTVFHSAMTEQIRDLPPPTLKLVLAMIEREFPGIAAEEDFRAVAQSHQVSLTGPAGVAAAAGTLVAQMSQYFVPNVKPPESGGDVERMLVHVAAVLDAFSASFVALRKGHDQFESEMALTQGRQGGEQGPLSHSTDPREVLGYLLDWSADTQNRVQELTGLYADIMIHQVALLNGLMEGVRSLLQRLGPAQIDREVADLPIKIGPITIPRVLWPFRSAARWARYAQRHRELTEEDREITSAVFGREFARAYAGVVGENFTEGGGKRLNDGGRR